MTLATIDCSALGHNLSLVRRHIAPNCDILAVIKADAYGHGAIPIAKYLLTQGVSRFAVATLSEGLALRQAEITQPIIVMGGLQLEEFQEAIAHQLTPILYSMDQASQLQERVLSQSSPYPIHLKVDTGMGRLGFSVTEALTFLQDEHVLQCFQIEGIMSHLSDGDNPDQTFTREQIQKFETVLQAFHANHLSVPFKHLANSAGILQHPSSHFNMVRPGIMLYGYHSLPSSQPPPNLKPVLSLTTTVVQIRSFSSGHSVSYNRSFITTRPSRIAVLPIGYADGLNRLLSNKGHVLIQGQTVPIVGRVCMDMTMIDITDCPNVRPGEEVVLLGRQGEAKITAADLADTLDTIPYEILCSIGSRVPRTYLLPSEEIPQEG